MSAPALHREGFRYDIQGLRAVAVVLVVLDHAFHVPAGGFVGVDVFYVISGFLITGLLLRELDQTGSVSLRAFYARRARRIVPAAALVLAVTTVGAWIVWFAPRALQVTLDALSALFFVSNWHFAELGTDYLQAEGPVSPVQHYWSLSIEEQFYAVWPLLLFALFVILKARRRLLVVVIVLAIALGLAIAAYRTVRDPSAAYFETWGRVWELLLGALIACVGSGPERLGRVAFGPWARRGVSILGLVLIIGSAVVLTPESSVPFPGVIPAVVGSAFVIWAGAPTARRGLLGNPVSQWLGDVSYSLYLWHFPVLIFGVALFGDSVWVAVAAIPVMLALSELSRRFVEQPVMRGGFLRRAAKAWNPRRFVVRDVLFGLAVLVAIGALSVAQLKGPAWVRSGADLADRIGNQRIETRETVSDPVQRAADVQSALDAGTWPAGPASDLEVLSLAQQGDAMLRDAPGCRNNVFDAAPPLVCEPAAAGDREAMVVGDSIALSWVPTVEAAGDEVGWVTSAVGYANCPLFDVSATNNTDEPGFRGACAHSRDRMMDVIEERSPDILFLSASEISLEFTELPLAEAKAKWQAGVERTLSQLAALPDAPQVVVLGDPPRAGNMLECPVRVGGPAACAAPVSDTYLAKAEADRAAVAASSGVVYVDTLDWFCADGRCPAFAGEHVIRMDVSHLTDAEGRALGPLLSDALRDAGL
ncbi:acyltransferase family protein [Microbacterium rhizophilus]|uniref:acyltransferase family protein n=1 Tax=Microbacterium rhizophilus TaxID=3138934 RepID=UPI0031EE3832